MSDAIASARHAPILSVIGCSAPIGAYRPVRIPSSAANASFTSQYLDFDVIVLSALKYTGGHPGVLSGFFATLYTTNPTAAESSNEGPKSRRRTMTVIGSRADGDRRATAMPRSWQSAPSTV